MGVTEGRCHPAGALGKKMQYNAIQVNKKQNSIIQSITMTNETMEYNNNLLVWCDAFMQIIMTRDL